MSQASLATVLSYQHPEVVIRFGEQFKVSEADAHELFQETKKMLWVMARHSFERGQAGVPPTFSIYEPMTALDEMWHTFILFTKDYTDFCQTHFGYYIHHSPSTSVEKKADVVKEEMVTELKGICRYVGRHLGAATVRRWFLEYPQRFSVKS